MKEQKIVSHFQGLSSPLGHITILNITLHSFIEIKLAKLLSSHLDFIKCSQTLLWIILKQ